MSLVLLQTKQHRFENALHSKRHRNKLLRSLSMVVDQLTDENTLRLEG